MKKLTYFFLYLILFSPFLGIIYTIVLGLPKYITFVFTLLFFIFGVFYVIFKKNIHVPKFLWLLFIFAIYKLVWIEVLSFDKNPFTILFHSVEFFTIFFTIIIIYNTQYTDQFINNTINVFKITVVITVVVSVIQIFDISFLDASYYMKDDPDSSYKTTLYAFRRDSIFGFVDRNAIGLAFIPIISVLTGFILFNKRKRYLFYLTLGGFSALLTNSRYVIIGFFLVTLQVLVFNKQKLKGYIQYFASTTVLALVLFLSLQYFGYDMENWYEERLFIEGSITETSRYNAFITFAVFFPKTPIFGTGHQTDEIKFASKSWFGSSHIHVGYLSLLVDYGIIGCFFLFGFWFYLLRRLYRNAKKTNYWGAFFAYLVFFWALSTMSEFSIFYSGLLFTLI